MLLSQRHHLCVLQKTKPRHNTIARKTVSGSHVVASQLSTQSFFILSKMSDPFLGEIRIFPYNFCPRGWAEANGQLLPISQNSALFSLLGTIYGGDGRTTFSLPDLRGRAPIHQGNGPGLSNYPLGSKGGVESVTLTQAQIPNHDHTVSLPWHTHDIDTSSLRASTQCNTIEFDTSHTHAVEGQTVQGSVVTNNSGNVDINCEPLDVPSSSVQSHSHAASLTNTAVDVTCESTAEDHFHHVGFSLEDFLTNFDSDITSMKVLASDDETCLADLVGQNNKQGNLKKGKKSNSDDGCVEIVDGLLSPNTGNGYIGGQSTVESIGLETSCSGQVDNPSVLVDTAIIAPEDDHGGSTVQPECSAEVTDPTYNLNIEETLAVETSIQEDGQIEITPECDTTLSGTISGTVGDPSYDNPPPSSSHTAPNTGSIGGSQSHENRPPYLTLRYCIAMVGIFPSRS